MARRVAHGVAGGDDRAVGFDDVDEVVAVAEVVRVKQAQDVKEVVGAEVDGGRRQHQLVGADVAQQAAGLPGARAFVAHVVRFVEDDEVK